MDSGISVTSVTTPALFVGPSASPAQAVRIRVRRRRPAGPLHVTVRGPGLRTPHPRLLRADTAEECAGEAAWSTVEVGVHTGGAPPGSQIPATARVTTPDGRTLAELPFTLTVAEPGWTVRLVPHFHYDPLWWNTQAAYTALWDAPPAPGAPRPAWEYVGVPAFTLVPLHLQQARDDPAYRFVLCETDYLKPYWDAHPEDRAELRALIAEGRLEIVGGTYNEPSTTLTSAESTVRSAVHGLALHRATLGADPRTAWQLDVFGHDPSFPALMAGCGLDSAVLARGPHHQWGPMMDAWGEALRPPAAMQLPAEYEWIAPSGEGLLLHYLPAHYSAGWPSHRAPDAEAAAERLLELYELLRPAAATKNVLIPMGTDFSWPHRWGLDVRHAWNRRYRWPRMEHSGPRAHFDAVRAELAARGERPLPVTREMGPVYTGKDVSYADVKQAHRAAENLLEQAEAFAALACAEGLLTHPGHTLAKAWRHLLHAAHHDAVTGTFSDQVYLDLLPTWREAHELADAVREEALAALTAAADTRGPGPLAVTVHNPLSWTRTDLVRTRVDLAAVGLTGDGAARLAVLDAEGRAAAVHLEAVRGGDAHVVFLAADVPPLGHRTWWLAASPEPLSGGWGPAAGTAIDNGLFRAEADPQRGGGLTRVLHRRTGQEILTPGEVDELVVQEEHAQHPYFGEGPWHLLPKGPGTGSGGAPARSCRVERGPLGSRIVSEGRTGPVRWTRVTTLWDGLDRVELTTRVDFEGSDTLLRLRIPADVPGALPVAETAAAAVGRGFAFPEADAGADHTRAPWTLDSACLNWFALSAPMTGPGDCADAGGAGAGGAGARARAGAGGDCAGGAGRALGACEIVLPEGAAPPGLRELVTALGRLGVTATPTRPGGPRWGDLAVDSSLPDFRIALGGPGRNPFTATVLASAGPAYGRALREHARAWIPARAPLRELWVPGCDLTGPRDLPVLVHTGPPGRLAGGLTTTGRLVPPPPAHPGDRPGGRPGDRAGGLTTTGRLVPPPPALAGVRPGGRPGDRAGGLTTTGRLVPPPPALAGDLLGDRPGDPAGDRPQEHAEDPAGDRPQEHAEDPAGDRPGAPAGDQPEVHAGDCPGAVARSAAAAGAPMAGPREVPYAGRTVGVLVRGTPSFAIDTRGRLHSTLLRSCTGRPSGEWMDPPRRTAPDGSSFQLQHWTHVFEHALVAGHGDWREADLPRRGREFNKPLTAVTAAPGPGPRPPARSLLAVEPADRILVEAVKRAEGGADLAVRLRETHGRPAFPVVTRSPEPAGGAVEADLLDRPRGPFGGRVDGAATTTLLLPTRSGMPERAGEREPIQPVFSRYWLQHRNGPAR
ncbi:hypothetical protein AB4039_13490 [Streptomyces sp. M-16]|uniref:glycoside hydrolase family 38 N-terminal domain-containing protein n=1 Tax=Streptomyces sp. M-16 TaxID=3233040 RepID=UPI003F96305F